MITSVGIIRDPQNPSSPEKSSESQTILQFRVKKLGVAVIIALGTTLAAAALATSILAALSIVHITVAIGMASACAAVAIIALWRKITPFLPPPLKEISQLVQALADEILAKLFILFLFPLNLERFDPKTKKETKKDEVPVLFIHGFLGSSRNWVYQRRRLQEAGCKNLFTINLGNPLISIWNYAEKVRKKLQQMQEITGRKDVILVSHSMGGLVAQEFLYNHNAEGVNVRKIITMGTPFQGTKTAWLASWISKCCQEMVPGSSTIQDLQAREEKDTKTRFCRIASKGDFMILPKASATGHPPTEEQHVNIIELEATGHAGELFSDAVGDIVVMEVKKEQAKARTQQA